MSCCLDPRRRSLPVEGEMDRLRILTADLGTIPSIADYGHIKTEPISCHTPQIITIKQELPTTAQFFVKSEIHDSPHYTTPDEQKNCISMPAPTTPPTPTEDTSDKVLVGSTSRFLPSVPSNHGLVYECVVYVKGDTTMLSRVEFLMNQEYPDQVTHIRDRVPFEVSEKCTKEKVVKVRLHFKDKNIPTQVVQPVRFDRSKSGFICQGPETAVELPSDVTEKMRVAEIAKWLETGQNGPNSASTTTSTTPPTTTHSITNRQVVFQNNVITSDTMLSGTLQWTKSAPSSPLSPASSPGDNRITRSASSSPIRQQTVLPNPCCRLQKPITQPVLSHEPILSARSAVDGEPLAKRRPAPIASMNISSINHRFTPISLPESPTLLATSQTTAIPMERITAENISSVQEGVQIGMLAESLPTGTITLGEQPSSQIFVASPSTKVQHISLIRDVQSLHNGPIKQEFFVRNEPNHSLDTPTEITLGTATVTAQSTNITQSDNEHLRNQRTGRKCRKVYGVNNRHLWCTACRWKKACRRFPS